MVFPVASLFSTTTVEKRSEKPWGPSLGGGGLRTSFSIRCGRKPRQAKSTCGFARTKPQKSEGGGGKKNHRSKAETQLSGSIYLVL